MQCHVHRDGYVRHDILLRGNLVNRTYGLNKTNIFSFFYSQYLVLLVVTTVPRSRHYTNIYQYATEKTKETKKEIGYQNIKNTVLPSRRGCDRQYRTS